MKKVIHFNYGEGALCDMEQNYNRKHVPDLSNNEDEVTCKRCLDIIGRSAIPVSYWDRY